MVPSEITIVSILLGEALSLHYSLHVLPVRMNAFLVLMLLRGLVRLFGRCYAHGGARGELGRWRHQVALIIVVRGLRELISWPVCHDIC